MGRASRRNGSIRASKVPLHAPPSCAARTLTSTPLSVQAYFARSCSAASLRKAQAGSLWTLGGSGKSATMLVSSAGPSDPFACAGCPNHARARRATCEPVLAL